MCKDLDVVLGTEGDTSIRKAHLEDAGWYLVTCLSLTGYSSHLTESI